MKSYSRSVKWANSNPDEAAKLGAEISGFLSLLDSNAATMASIKGGHERRWDDWKLQERLAEKLAAEALMLEEQERELDLANLLIDDNTDEEVLDRIAAQAAIEAAKTSLTEVESTD